MFITFWENIFCPELTASASLELLPTKMPILSGY